MIDRLELYQQKDCPFISFADENIFSNSLRVGHRLESPDIFPLAAITEVHPSVRLMMPFKKSMQVGTSESISESSKENRDEIYEHSSSHFSSVI